MVFLLKILEIIKRVFGVLKIILALLFMWFVLCIMTHNVCGDKDMRLICPFACGGESDAKEK